jgi:protein arginine N-methyltransferase 7
MYAGHDKYGGDVVGGDEGDDGADLKETLENSSMEEMLVVTADVGAGPEEVVLCARLNVDEGGLLWVPEADAAHTYKSAIAMSQMTSMLHDRDRNEKYNVAISMAVRDFHAKFKRWPIVLDVGTGTGLLAMMAVRAGAEHVYACEVKSLILALEAHIVGISNSCRPCIEYR